MKSHFQGAGWEAPKATEFLFSSMDGHLPPIPKPGQSRRVNDRCTFDLERCLGSFWSRRENVSADDMFKRLAFANPSCGDCCKCLPSGGFCSWLIFVFSDHGTRHRFWADWAFCVFATARSNLYQQRRSRPESRRISLATSPAIDIDMARSRL